MLGGLGLLCVVWTLCCRRDIIGTVLTCDRPCRCIALEEIPPGIEMVFIRSPSTNTIKTTRGGHLIIQDQRQPYADSDSDRTFCTEGVTAVVRGKVTIYCEVQSTPMTDMDPTSSGLTISSTPTLPHTTDPSSVWSSYRLESSFGSMINPTESAIPSTLNEPMTSIKPPTGDSDLAELTLDVIVILVMVPVLTILVIFLLVVACCKGCRCATTYSTAGTPMRPSSSITPDSPESVSGQSPSVADSEEEEAVEDREGENSTSSQRRRSVRINTRRGR